MLLWLSCLGRFIWWFSGFCLYLLAMLVVGFRVVMVEFRFYYGAFVGWVMVLGSWVLVGYSFGIFLRVAWVLLACFCVCGVVVACVF